MIDKLCILPIMLSEDVNTKKEENLQCSTKMKKNNYSILKLLQYFKTSSIVTCTSLYYITESIGILIVWQQRCYIY